MNEKITNLYTTDEYITKNPTLHEEDSPWKIEKLLPLIDKFMKSNTKNTINLLDVGGGAGVILNALSSYITQNYQVKVNKYILDLSPKMLQAQASRNPDIIKALPEDIRKTSLPNKHFDLTLLVDVLEHVPNPEEALKELQRISNYVIFKVPLEDYFVFNIANFLTKGATKQQQINNYGHINVYSTRKIKKTIKKNNGTIIIHEYTNLHQYYKKSKKKLGLIDKTIANFATATYHISPRIAASLFGDNSIILTRCYEK